MNRLVEKIKNIFERKEKSETIESKKDKLLHDATWGASDIARSIQESKKFQTRKRWRNISHF